MKNNSRTMEGNSRKKSIMYFQIAFCVVVFLILIYFSHLLTQKEMTVLLAPDQLKGILLCRQILFLLFGLMSAVFMKALLSLTAKEILWTLFTMIVASSVVLFAIQMLSGSVDFYLFLVYNIHYLVLILGEMTGAWIIAQRKKVSE